MRFLRLPWFLWEVSRFLVTWVPRSGKSAKSFLPSVRKIRVAEAENMVEKNEISLLDLPDLPLDCILERLSPSGLRSMAAVCSSLRERCRDDHFWEKHMKQKWGRLIGNAAYRQWQCQIASRNKAKLLKSNRPKGIILGYLSDVSLTMWLRNPSKVNNFSSGLGTSLPDDSIMAWYSAIETGKFWFPAQVYNRENGHVGFMLSCYDAEVRYESSTNTFIARYLANGRQTIEDNIDWNRLRAPAVDIPAHVLHVSDCLDDLRPGDHIEVQWRRNEDFPYGWWYGVVGHLESCNGQDSHCQCHQSDIVTLEFKQYTHGSRWRQTLINRKDHREVGNGGDGFYGGVRKLCNEKEISMWKCLWPSTTLD